MQIQLKEKRGTLTLHLSLDGRSHNIWLRPSLSREVAERLIEDPRLHRLLLTTLGELPQEERMRKHVEQMAPVLVNELSLLVEHEIHGVDLNDPDTRLP